MDWDWKEFFNKIDNIQLLKVAVISKENYINDKVTVKFLAKNDNPVNLVYRPWSEKYFTLSFADKRISIDKKYFLFFIEDALEEQFFYKDYTNKDSFEYITYGFLFEMHLAKESSSGTTTYKDHLNKLVSLVQKKSISIQGSGLISSKQQLEHYLKKEFSGFKSLDVEIL